MYIHLLKTKPTISFKNQITKVQYKQEGDLIKSTQCVIDTNITLCFIVREACDSFFIQLHDYPYTTQTFSACLLLYVSICLLLSLFPHLVKCSLFILKVLLRFKRAQRIEEVVAVKVLRLSQLSSTPWGRAMLSLIYVQFTRHKSTFRPTLPHLIQSNTGQWMVG